MATVRGVFLTSFGTVRRLPARIQASRTSSFFPGLHKGGSRAPWLQRTRADSDVEYVRGSRPPGLGWRISTHVCCRDEGAASSLGHFKNAEEDFVRNCLDSIAHTLAHFSANHSDDYGFQTKSGRISTSHMPRRRSADTPPALCDGYPGIRIAQTHRILRRRLTG